MEEIETYARAAISILGFAYPIIFQIISKLDDKYASIQIVELFGKEKIKIWFERLLVISLVSIFIWSFKFEPLFQINRFNYLINHSADIFVLTSVTFLVFLFFLLVKKILIYYTPAKFINYLIHKHSKKIDDLKYFDALSDVFLNSIRKENESISHHISRFFYDAFKKERDKFQKEPIIYPNTYYLLVHKTIEELSLLKSKRYLAIKSRTAGGIWLLGELQDFEISEQTYSWLWRNILLAVGYEQDDMVLLHWENAHQYFTLSLEPIRSIRVPGTLEIKNEESIKMRERERNRFLEFHYALGGLLFYKKRYSCMLRLFRYTTSQPPKYDMLPETMDEIFTSYINFIDPYDINHSWISTKYAFPDQNGLNADNIIKGSICRYISILFLRQYTLNFFQVHKDPLKNPRFPAAQAEKKLWMVNLDFFKEIVSKNIQNHDLMKILDLDFITPEWCILNKKIHPLDFIDDLKKSLEDSYAEGQIISLVSNEKVILFKSSSSKILADTLGSYMIINNAKTIDEEFNKWFVKGQTLVMDKDAFAESPEAHYFEYNSFFANSLSNRVKEGISLTFSYNKTASYLLEPEDLFKAVDALGLGKDYSIISFGINIPYYVENLKINELALDNFKGIPIISFDTSRAVEQSIFIIKTIHLPTMIFKGVDKDLINKYSLESISDKFNIFASVLDLNYVDKEIINENLSNRTEDDLKKSVLLCIIYILEIRWMKNISVLQLIEYSQYVHDGLPNKAEDILRYKQ